MGAKGGFFDSMRRSHPVKLGDTIHGKRVVSTYNVSGPGIPGGVIGSRACTTEDGQEWLDIGNGWQRREEIGGGE